ncbi:hypothetical protein HHK36_027010 [Tetracentron sinense]|uniref:Midasin n=1 Tax=Tetracentron sinense TaxID=13715 RepID=A0A834YGV8_TETSI|nr:hypothetical protein HHK36_027010 [Tetracentron sinense]
MLLSSRERNDSPGQRRLSTIGWISLGVLWRRVMISPWSNKDLLDIVIAWYPNLEVVAEKLIETFERINSGQLHQFGGSHVGKPASFGPSNRFSLRDLLKWCKRITGLGFSFRGLSLSAFECKSIFQEVAYDLAVEVFAASSASAETRITIMKDIAKMWTVPVAEAETLYPLTNFKIKKFDQNLHSYLQVGRITIKRAQAPFLLRHQKRFVEIRCLMHLLERIACSVKYNEPVLLVGETGTGKTTLVQNLAVRLRRRLTVLVCSQMNSLHILMISYVREHLLHTYMGYQFNVLFVMFQNLSQQSDIADLLGGFKPAKPTDAQFICISLYDEFKELFSKTFPKKENGDFLDRLDKHLNDKNWKMLLNGIQKGLKFFAEKDGEVGGSGHGTKRKRPLGEEILQAWDFFSIKLDTARKQIGASAGVAFSFVEGAFVSALRNGDWILLDEVNLAPPETLQRVIGVLEGENGSLCLAERGDVDYIDRHPDFRLFACMNPATDAGKRDLPYSLRSRFTEYFVDDVFDDEDLALFINEVMGDTRPNRELVSKIVHFYKEAKSASEERLQDGANQKPQFSLRSLSRALQYMKEAEKKFGFQKALYDGFCMFFLILLDGPSAKIMNKKILYYLLEEKLPPHVPFDGYIVSRGDSRSDVFLENYVLTKSVKEHLRNLSRPIFIKSYPVLLQGPTSSGKTSLVQYLAAITGHEFVRINNHEHTDLQEYLGSYITDAYGKLVFQEGVLVKAVRQGYWIVLDELNLAPSDVLEALNRLLDDHRELFVPELQETVRAHPDFMLFATQNPPNLYGGRKFLSRAFRNRFVEIHVDEIPEDELSIILEMRCRIPESYAKKMVEVMKELQLHRQSSKVFAGKHGFITPRDLFRWADRFRTFGNSYEDLAKDGYLLLAERLRADSEKNVVQEVLKRHLRVKSFTDDLYMEEQAKGNNVLDLCEYSGVQEGLGSMTVIIWTTSMWRLYFLVERCYKMREPVLLVGETGGGKTTVCQLLSIILGSKLHILNCHQYTETSDFLGGFYPVRDRPRLTSEFKYLVEQLMLSKAYLHFTGDNTISLDISQASSTIDQLTVIINSYREGLVSYPDVTVQDLDALKKVKQGLVQLYQKWQTIFMWQDGPLVQAMKDGDLFLVDEISLADDSVLERLNSVLETERKLTLAEKGGSALEKIIAHPNFFLLATMNPGGDYGKKELSPALRNRFTEIWVPPVSDLNELRRIALDRLVKPELSYIVDPMLNFWEWFNQLQTGRMLTVRDLLAWVAFINVTERSLRSDYAFIHGAFLVLLDGLSLGTGISKTDAGDLRERCLSFLLKQMKEGNTSMVDSHLSRFENYGWEDLAKNVYISCSINVQSNDLFGIDPFYIAKGDENCEHEGFEFLAPTTRRNALRVLRAMQLAKPVLLEGSPGVGKTSLVVALGKFSGHRVVRINLSEQTDIMDLLGSDLPVEGEAGMKFAWSDGILLQALKNGSWVLLDELNLAPQSGLNAILDHRAEVFIPELGLTFKCPPSFRAFACQNPSSQGGGRKGFPKSFLNRFTKVYVDELVEDDYLFICSSLYPSIPRPLLSKLIFFNKRLHEDTMLFRKFAQDGSPWEFNLRDVIRSCEIIEGVPEKSKVDCFLSIVYIQRMRTAADRKEVLQLYEEVFGVKPYINPYPRVQVNPRYLIVGNTAIERNHFQPSQISRSQLKILPGIRHVLEAVVHCVRHQWLCILVGPSSSGKSSSIRLLAELTGNVINELNLSSATDISELLGCFEQYNGFRNFRFVIAQVERYINEYCSIQLESSMDIFLIERKDLISRWLAFLSCINCSSIESSACNYSESWKSCSLSSLDLLAKIIEQLKFDLEKYQLSLSWSHKDLDKMLKTILNLREDYRRRPFPEKFEWVTGLLINAIESGEWIVLENANLCNPTVLDRINSLVEPSGSITVNECGLVDGGPVVLRPHPKFRMFLTVNPRYGEVSRAMRNRGVEIFMMQPYWLLDRESGYNLKGTELIDVKRILVLSGIPVGKLVDAMAEAHVYAKGAGSCIGVRITFLELTRWVQLFQQLIMNGSRPIWSLQISWEHTYMSSLGEVQGRDVVTHAKLSYLSTSKLSKLDALLGCSLPGGWPAPLKLRDFIWYSREACVKQNCMYLEFLGAQCASYELSVDRSGYLTEQALTASGHAGTSLLMDMKQVYPAMIPLQMLHRILFPTASNGLCLKDDNQTNFDLTLANKKLFFAANWAIEQATESDLELYLLWFRWFSSRLQPFCRFFESFLVLLKQEKNHPIWNCIVGCRRELTAYHHVDYDMQPIPMLSLELVEITASSEVLKSFNRPLRNAIQCIGLLRLSFQQWNAEGDYNSETLCFKPVLESLQNLEKEVLNILVESPCFDLLVQLYTNLLEDHMLFWEGITTSQIEYLLISWRSLKKIAVKLQDLFPEAVELLLVESRNLVKVSSWSLHSLKSMLWVHGGHPFLPSSAEIYYKLRQLLSFCELVWPMKTKSWKHGNDSLVEAIVSSNTELRFVAMQGVCMSSYFTSKCDEEDVHIVQQLEEMYQMLLGRFEYEKHKLETFLESNDHASSIENLAACCAFCPEMLSRKSGFDSWQEILPIIDSTSFFLDMELLQELSKFILVGTKELYLVLSNTSELLECAFNFSLNFSSRAPTDFLPHQKILWTLDAWTSVDSVNTKVASFILEMWFRWHSSLWTHCSEQVKNFSRIDGCHIPLPYMLAQPTKTAALDHILQGTFPINDYPVHCLKLRAASGYLWKKFPSRRDVPIILFSAARSLFQQIVFAHEKSFEADKYAKIKSILGSVEGNTITQDNLQTVTSLIASSSHSRLTSLVDSFIEPMLRELYLQCSPHGSLYNLGCAWLHIGGLRFCLLLNCDDFDPAMKYSFKHSKLVEKISLLELEIKVRKESEHLAGRFSTRDDQEQRVCSLAKLDVEQKRLKRKIVFRSDPSKFKKLKSECDEFLVLVTSSAVLIKNLEGMNIQQMIDQSCNWQETATGFIKRLSDEYPAYIDMIEPVQVAVYEMKLGLSLVVSSALQKSYLNKVEEDNMDRILETIYSFMRFPRGCGAKSIPIEVKSCLPEFPSSDLDFPRNVWALDMKLLKKLCTIPRDTSPDKTVSVLKLNAALHHNILVRATHVVANSLLLDNAFFMLLDEIFDQFAMLWMDMKVQTKEKADYEAQQYKFRPRAFRIENILEIEISTLRNSLANESLCSEWQEMLEEEEFTERASIEEQENLEEEWNLVQESILTSLVHIHNQVFGSINLVQSIFSGAFVSFKCVSFNVGGLHMLVFRMKLIPLTTANIFSSPIQPGIIQVPDADRLCSFIDSYKLGTWMMKDLQALLFSSLDMELGPEHLLRLCLEHEQKFVQFHQSAHVYNFYKVVRLTDSNAPLMAKMVKPLAMLKQRIVSLLDEWTDHPGLQKILDVTEMLLAIPLSTPLAKNLSGLQFLLSRVQMVQENASKFSLSDQLEPIFHLVSSWQKMEFDSWPALLDGVQEQYEINAGKLWFPLYSVLHHRHSADITEDHQSTIQRHVPSHDVLILIEFCSPCLVGNLKILYNVFGNYVQFLPIIAEHIEANRRKIEMELKELSKLCRWEHPDSYLSVETFKRTRQKIRKLIQKFNDVLQLRLSDILNQEEAQRGIKTLAMPGPKFFNDASDKNGVILLASLDLAWFTDKDRSIWCVDWRKKVDSALQNLHPRKTSGIALPYLCFKDNEEVENIISQWLASQSACLIYQEEWKEVWCSLEKISRTATECGDLWQDGNMSLGKRRALTDLLKLLESCGLSRHKSAFFEDQLKSNQPSRWFLQPSYDPQHLLLTKGELSPGNVDATASSRFQRLEKYDSNWEMANQYYFRSIASVQLLRKICLNFHKDFSLEQVNRSASFLDHLVIIQQEQRATAYCFAERLRSLRKCTYSLENIGGASTSADHGIGSECSLTPNQHATLKCMWQQKQLFDSLYAMSYEVSLLLKTVENAHLNTCQSVKVEANKILVFIDKFIPDFQKSKESLDNYLLSHDRIITTVATSFPPFLISKQMEQLVMQNFRVISNFEEQVQAFCRQAANRRSMNEALLSCFGDIFNMGRVIVEEFHSVLEPRNPSEEDTFCAETYTELEAAFAESFQKTFKQILQAFEKLGSLSNGHTHSEDSLGNVTSWKMLFESRVVNLQLDPICEELANTIVYAGKLVNYAGHVNPELCSQVGTYVKHLPMLLDLILNFGDGLLKEFLAMHRTVAETTHMLANIFASLYSKGFGSSAEDQVDDTSCDISRDAKGTGMGEGAGLNDVSDQIDDEDQLLGTSEKPSDSPDESNEVPSKNNKGIEMDQDFAADTFSVSEDSGDDHDEDSEDEELESAMEENLDDSEIVNEKLWSKDEDGNLNNLDEKYESGPSIRDTDSSCRELRAKEDCAATVDESGELNPGEPNKQNDEDKSHDGPDNKDLVDMKMDKEDAFADPTGLELDEPNQGLEEDTNMEEAEGADTMDESGPEEHEESAEDGIGEDGKINSMDGDMEEAESGQVDGNCESDDSEKDHGENAEDLVAPSKDVFELGKVDFAVAPVPNVESATEPNGESQAADSSAAAPEMQWSNRSDMQNALAPMGGLPSSNISEMKTTVPDSSRGGKLTDDQPKAQLPQLDTSSMQRTHPNPYRNVGDALKEWKERVKVSIDLQEETKEAPDDIEDENAEEFGYVTEFEKGTDQARGPATSDQIDRNINGNMPNGDDLAEQTEDPTEMEIEKEDSEKHPVRSYSASIPRQKIDEHVQNSDLNNDSHLEGSPKVDDHNNDDPGSLSESLVSVKKSYMSEGILQLSNLSVNDEDLGKANNLEEASRDIRDNATAQWRRYELLTTRLSQELAEQLRLVMQPTLASKLQGDYKTGKRINMKKVIQYIASHYRKDKIWLRRTRPSKRDYQVVIAVDDSSSMAESRCGDVAIEALVTVCRAMSQLEVGKLAVASFGKKGNIRLLHDFDQPFTGESGIKIISSLTFKQENTIADEPMVDLLKYLNNILDAAVANARGQNPLEQLVLIIADGRVHEKNLKRCVRDVLSRKRMVTFLLLDSPQESIMDLMEVSTEDEGIKLTKYLDSFPFPYYIVLKNIEALPRTLADLLRQWFELMQNARD